MPVVSACAVAELGATLAVSTDAACTLVAETLELAYRLNGRWERVLGGRVPVWRARQVAARTLTLPDEAARFVDGQLACVPGSPTAVVLERLVSEALARFAPTSCTDAPARRSSSAGWTCSWSRPP